MRKRDVYRQRNKQLDRLAGRAEPVTPFPLGLRLAILAAVLGLVALKLAGAI